MSGRPTSRWHVRRRRTAGWPTGREPYGDGVPIVVAGVTTCQGGRESRPQGEGAQVIERSSEGKPAECSALKRSWTSCARSGVITGEQDAGKPACPVREEA